jgi:predicted lipoprotein with Yx(FWY)xxD motif
MLVTDNWRRERLDMLDRQAKRSERGGRRRLARLAATATCALALVASLSAIAFAGSTATVSASHSATLKQTIVVNSQGLTLYWLSGESTHHLLCRTSECFKFWPPLTVSSAHASLRAGAGVHGSLGVIHRNGIFQVTLRGAPLYRYYEDRGRGEANGEGIRSFGGTWHAVSAA